MASTMTITPEGQALLDVIAGTESKGAYDIIYGGSRFDDYTAHPNQYVAIPSGPNAGKYSSAAGKYQFLKSTWDSVAKKYDLPDFSPASQDKAAWLHAQDVYRDRTHGHDLQADLSAGGTVNMKRISKALHSEWTSLPGGIEQGQGQGRFQKTYDRVLANNSGHPVPSVGVPNGGSKGKGVDLRAIASQVGNSGAALKPLPFPGRLGEKAAPAALTKLGPAAMNGVRLSPGQHASPPQVPVDAMKQAIQQAEAGAGVVSPSLQRMLAPAKSVTASGKATAVPSSVGANGQAVLRPTSKGTITASGNAAAVPSSIGATAQANLVAAPAVPPKTISPALASAFARLGAAVAGKTTATGTANLRAAVAEPAPVPHPYPVATAAPQAAPVAAVKPRPHVTPATPEERAAGGVLAPGAISPGKSTIVGGIVKVMASDAVKNALPNVKQAISNTTAAVQKNAAQVGDSLGHTASDIGNSLGKTFSGIGNFLAPRAAATPLPVASGPSQAQLLALRAISGAGAARTGATASGSAALKPSGGIAGAALAATGGISGIASRVAGGVSGAVSKPTLTATGTARPSSVPTVSLAQINARQEALKQYQAQVAAQQAAAAAKAKAAAEAQAAARASQLPGTSYLNAQGVNTQGLTIGQQANELNKAMSSSSRDDRGNRSFGPA
ncbi:MAG: hypothetical protein JWM16_6360 [Verrucomicrobiales bacterium]|nr:hypothetical protein [Verrucomicrobiales bacterium]